MKATHVLLDLIARTKNAVRDLDNLNYRKMRKILMNDNCDDQSTIGDDGRKIIFVRDVLVHFVHLLAFLISDVSVSDMNEEDGNGRAGNGGADGGEGSSKSNSVASERSLHSTGVSASSQGSSTNSLPVAAAIDPETGHTYGMVQGAAGTTGSAGRHHPHHHLHPSSAGGASSQPSPMAPIGFHRPQQAAAQAAAAKGGAGMSSGANPRKMMSAAASLASDETATLDPKNFATIRTTSIVQRQQKEHLHEEMHDQMSGYKRLRRDHQAALARLEEACRQEMEKHKSQLDREYEQLLTQFSKDLERLQLKHQEELNKKVCILMRQYFIFCDLALFVFAVEIKYSHGEEVDQGDNGRADS